MLAEDFAGAGEGPGPERKAQQLHPAFMAPNPVPRTEDGPQGHTLERANGHLNKALEIQSQQLGALHISTLCSHLVKAQVRGYAEATRPALCRATPALSRATSPSYVCVQVLLMRDKIRHRALSRLGVWFHIRWSISSGFLSNPPEFLSMLCKNARSDLKVTPFTGVDISTNSKMSSISSENPGFGAKMLKTLHSRACPHLATAPCGNP